MLNVPTTADAACWINRREKYCCKIILWLSCTWLLFGISFCDYIKFKSSLGRFYSNNSNDMVTLKMFFSWFSMQQNLAKKKPFYVVHFKRKVENKMTGNRKILKQISKYYLITNNKNFTIYCRFFIFFFHFQMWILIICKLIWVPCFSVGNPRKQCLYQNDFIGIKDNNVWSTN